MSQTKSEKYLAVFMSLFCIFFTSSALQAQEAIQIKGSDTMVNLGQAWSEEFMMQHPDENIAVTGGGSGTGIAAIISGTCDIAQASRKMTDEEMAKAKENVGEIKEWIVGYDGIAVIVHPSNSVSKLTLEQLSGIFTGRITNWSELGGVDKEILVLSRDRNSGTHVFFLEHVLRQGKSKSHEEYSQDALMMPSSQSIIQEVENSPVTIGYVGLGYVSDKEKLIAVSKGEDSPYVQPSLETVQNATYPVSRPLYFYTVGEPRGVVKDYIAFVMGDEGQEIIKLMDFVPLK